MTFDNNTLISKDISLSDILNWCDSNGITPIPCQVRTKKPVGEISTGAIYGTRGGDSFHCPTPERLTIITNYWNRPGVSKLTRGDIAVSIDMSYPTRDGYTITCVDIDNWEYVDLADHELFQDCEVFTGKKGTKVFFKLDIGDHDPTKIADIIQYRERFGEQRQVIELFTRNKHALIFGEHEASTYEKPIYYQPTRGLRPLPVIKLEDLGNAIDGYIVEHDLEIITSDNAVTSQKPHNPNSITEQYGLKCEDFLMPTNPYTANGKIIGTHPIHGSTTGHNIEIDVNTNTWICRRCNHGPGTGGGGGAVEALAVAEGIITCEEAKPGCIKTKEQWREIFAALERRGVIQPQPTIKPTVIEPKPLESIVTNGFETKPMDVRLSTDNFVKSWIDYASEKSDAYIDYHHAVAITIVSTILDRKAFIEMKQGRYYPNTWCLILGPSTIARKTTAFGELENVKKFLLSDTIKECPTQFSTEALTEFLSLTSHTLWHLDECGQLLKKMNQKRGYLADLRDILCKVYDCHGYSRKLRTKRGDEQSEFNVDDPYITAIMGTTPDTLTESASIDDITSGLLPRFLIYNPRYQKKFMGFEPIEDKNIDDRLRVENHIQKIVHFMKSKKSIKFYIDAASLHEFTEWHKNIEKRAYHMNNEGVSAFVGRLVVYAFKLGMIYTVSDLDFIEKYSVLDMPDLHIAIKPEYLMEACREIESYFIPMAIRTADIIRVNDARNVQEKIIQALKRAGGKCTLQQLNRHIRIPQKERDEALRQLVEETEEISIVSVDEPNSKKPITYVILKNDIITTSF